MADGTVLTGKIGAVEIKDDATDNRCKVSAANVARTASDKVLLVQTIDADGNVGSGGGDTPAAATYAKITDGTDTLAITAGGAAEVDIESLGGNTVSLGAGAVAVGTLRTTLASDDPAVASLGTMDDWDAVHDAAVGTDGVRLIGSARTSQEAAVANGDNARLVCNEHGELVLAGYTWATNSIRVEEIDPLSEKYVTETLIDFTNKANGTYYYYVDMHGYRMLGLQWDLTGTITITAEATIQDDGTTPASCLYTDVSNDWYGAASWSADDFITDSNRVAGQAKYVRVKVVCGGGGTDDLVCYAKRLW